MALFAAGGGPALFAAARGPGQDHDQQYDEQPRDWSAEGEGDSDGAERPPTPHGKPHKHKSSKRRARSTSSGGESEGEEEGRGHRHRHKHKRHKGHHSKRSHKQDKRGREKPEGGEREVPRARDSAHSRRMVWFEDLQEGESLFFFDSHHDRDQFVVGELYRLHVPPYRRLPVALTPAGFVSLHSLALGHHYKHVPPPPPPLASLRYYANPSLLRAPPTTTVRSKQRRSGPARAAPGEFVPVEREGDEEAGDRERKGVVVKEEEEDDEGDSSEDGAVEVREGEGAEQYIVRRTRWFNKHTQTSPLRPRLWQAFAEFQDHTLALGRGQSAHASALEKKISIYQTGLRNCPTSEGLVLGLFASATRGGAWDRPKTLAMWKKVLDNAPADGVVAPSGPGMWMEFLDFVTMGFSTFNATLARDEFHSAVDRAVRLAEALQGGRAEGGWAVGAEGLLSAPSASHSILPFLMFARCVQFEQACGYTEKAVAMCQAVVEATATTSSPSLSLLSRKQLRDDFKAYWESDQPRIGEEGTVGFAVWQRAADPNANAPAPHALHSRYVDADQHKGGEAGDGGEGGEVGEGGGVWGAESRLEAEQWMPIKGTDPRALEDGAEQRVVLHDDVKLFAIRFASPHLHLHAIFSLLHVFGVVGQPRLTSTNHPLSVLHSRHHPPLAMVCALVDALTSGACVWAARAAVARRANVEALQGGRLAFAQRFLCHSAQLFPAHKQTILETAVLCLLSRKGAKKVLKDHPHSLTLWTAYAHVEERTNPTEALRVVRAALSSAHSLPPSSSSSSSSSAGRWSLFAMLARLLLEHEPGRPHLVVGAVVGAVEGVFTPSEEQVSSTRVVKALAQYHHLLQQTPPSSAHWPSLCLCYCLYRLVTTPGATGDAVVEAAEVCTAGLWDEAKNARSAWVEPRKRFETKEQILEEGDWLSGWTKLTHAEDTQNANLEMFAEHVCGVLLLLLQQKRPLTPRLARQTVENALQHFPLNEVLLACYVTMETRANIAGRLRRHLDGSCAATPHPLLWLVACHTESLRDGTLYRVRALFEKAVDGSAQRCAAVWSAYMRFERQHSGAAACHRVFMRGMQRVPHSKELWMAGLELLHGAWNKNEVAEWAVWASERDVYFRSVL